MSVSKWAYAPEKCDGKPCVGDCDMCYKAEDEVSIPSVDALEYTQSVFSTARLSKGCIYPNCEKCGYYREHYCTVPMVVSKQIYLFVSDKIASMEKNISELETLVTDEILRSKEVRKHALHEDVNYTWADYFGRDDK